MDNHLLPQSNNNILPFHSFYFSTSELVSMMTKPKKEVKVVEKVPIPEKKKSINKKLKKKVLKNSFIVHTIDLRDTRLLDSLLLFSKQEQKMIKKVLNILFSNEKNKLNKLGNVKGFCQNSNNISGCCEIIIAAIILSHNINYFQLRATYRMRKYRKKHLICEYCKKAKSVCTHHIIPVSLGGRDIETNYMALCNKCHHDIFHPDMAIEMFPETPMFRKM